MKYLNQSGRSMVEMIGVLAIIGVLSVGALAGYSAAMEKYKANKIVNDVSHIVTNIKSLYPTSKYTGIDVQKLAKLNMIPDLPANTGKHFEMINNKLGGYILVAKSYAPEASLNNQWNENTENAAFIVGYTGLSESLCNKIATYDWTDSNLIGMMISSDVRQSATITQTCLKASPVDKNGKINDEIKCFSVGHETNGVPVTPEKAAAACSLCRGTNSCFVAWKHR